MDRTITRRGLLAAGAAATALAAAPAARAATVAYGNRYRLQRAFTDRRFGMFLHFNMGTFHDAEWVDPGQDPATFNPDRLDCGQWADAAAAAGMTFAVLTAKHHDGFCLWPSRYSAYTVAAGGYRHDVVGAYVDAFRARGITPCLYFSIWDRTHGVQAPVTREQITYVKNQLTELLTRYGRIPLLIFDGWAWQMGHQAVPYAEIRAHVAALQPDCLVLDLTGLSVPWESDLLFFEEPKGAGGWCPPGNRYAAAQGQTISPEGWFWHPSTPGSVLSPSDIVDGHLRVLEPRYCTFLLNCPPNPHGLLDDSVVAALREVGRSWRPDRSRPPLPAQPDVLRAPVPVVSATAPAAVDGHSDLAWSGEPDQTLATVTGPVTLDLGRARTIDALTYLPRQDAGRGDITVYRLEAGTDGAAYRTVAHGAWPADRTVKQARFRRTRARYVRLTPTSTADGGPAVISELDVGVM